MIEEVLHPANLMRACHQVVRNKGAAGVDGMQVKELLSYFRVHRERIKTSIREDRYLPQPMLGVEILKSNGKKRLWLLSISTSGTLSLSSITITNERLARRGYQSMTSLFDSISPHPNEPLYT
jgi:hypothetical protein